MNSFPSIIEQRRQFDSIRDSIDKILRSSGFEEILVSNNIDASLGRIVVARSFQYSTEKATINRDLDPMATLIETQYEVGVSEERPGLRFFNGLVVGNIVMGENTRQYDNSILSKVEQIVLDTSLNRLLKARKNNPWITKSLLKVDSAGD